MSATIDNNDSNSSADAGGESGAVDTSAADAGNSNQDTAAAGAEDSASRPVSKERELSGAEAAAARAKERFAADKNSSSDASEQAAAADNSGGESTQKAADGDAGSDTDGDATSDESSSEDNSDASTASAPENWPAAMKEQFAALPDDDARNMVLDMNKDMQAGMTKGMQQLKTQIEGNSSLFGLMDKHNVDASAMTDLVNKAVTFNDDPRALITQLASEKGIEVFFDQASAKGEVPEFENAADMALWAKDKAKKELAADNAAEATADKEAADIKATETRITQEFSQAATDHADFMDHREPVIEKMADIGEKGVSVEDAYRLSTYDGLHKLAEDGQKAINELAALKQKIEQSKKKDTAAPTGSSGEVNDDALKNLTPVQRAAARAKERISKAAH